MTSPLERTPEPEPMDLLSEARAYAMADFSQVNQSFVQDLLAFVDSEDAMRAIDLGTGPADIPIRLARRKTDWRITAVDVSAAMLALARNAVRLAGLEDRIELLQSDAKRQQPPGEGYDVILSNSILHHISDTATFWAQIRRIGRPGAWVFFRDLYRPDSTKAAQSIVQTHAGAESSTLREEYYRSLLSAYTPEEVRRQLRSAGLAGCLRVETRTDRHMDILGRLED